MNKLVVGCLGVFLSTSINAGTMGKEEVHPKFSPYFNIEASATWNSQGTYKVNTFNPSQSNSIWGGRFSGGQVWRYNSFGLIAEIGGGYYGKTRNANQNSGVIVSKNFDGYDALLGIMYNLGKYISPDFDIFGDVGFMVQNMRESRTYYYSSFVSGGFISGVNTQKLISTAALPEFKVGGIYNYNDHFSFIVSYLHVFGSKPDGIFTIQGTPGSSLNINGNQTYANPTFNTLLFGMRYYFA